MTIDIPGVVTMQLQHLVLDYNGTIARDGKLLSNLGRTLEDLASQITIHVLTADSYGSVAKELEGLPCIVHTIPQGQEAEAKARYVQDLGADQVVSIGNGANDRLMLKAARLGIAILEGEGSAVSAILNADIVARSSYDAFGLLMIPQRIAATLRT